MADSVNRLELDIVAIDDTAAATQKGRANFETMEATAAKSAAGISRSYSASGISIERSTERAAAGMARSLQGLEARASLAGKTGIEGTIAKLRQQEAVLIERAGRDEAQIVRITAATDRLVQAQLRLNEARSVRAQGTAAGQAVLSGEAEFAAALKRSQASDAAIANLQRQRETPAQRLRREEADFVSQYGTTPGKRTVIAEEFATQRKNATGTLKASLLQEEEALKAAELANANIFRRMAVHAKEWAASVVHSSKEVSTHLVETAEAGGIAGGGGKGGGGGILGIGGKLLGAGIVVGFAAHELDEYARMNVELDHLQTNTGIAARQLAGLQQIVKQHGGDWDAFTLGLSRMEVALGKAREGSKKQVEAFKDLGVSAKDIKTLTTEEVFYKVANGIANVKDHALLAADASVIFSRGWRLVVPIMKETGASLREATGAAAALSGVTPETTAQSYRLIEAHAKLSQIMRFLGNTTITLLAPAVQYLLVGFDALGAVVLSVFDVMAAGAVSAVRGISDVGTVLHDVVTGQFGKAVVDAGKVGTNFVGIWKGAGKDIGGQFAGLGKDREGLFAPPAIPSFEKDEPGEGDDEKGKKHRRSFGDGAYGREILDAQREYNSAQLELARKQREGTFKAFEDDEKRKRDAQRSLITEGDRLDTEARSHYFESQNADNERSRKLALSQLEFIDAQSIKEKRNLEDRKLEIETAYTERSLQIQIQKIQQEKSIALGKLQALANVAGPEGQAAYDADSANVINKANADMDEARRSAGDKELTLARDIANKKTQLNIEENRKIFDSLKHSAEGLFDVLLQKGKGLGDFFKGLFKAAILTPVKEIFSSQVAGIFTELLTGQKVTFNEVGSGQGRLGRVGSILGRLGLGTPRFGPEQGINKLDLPNHFGDGELVSGAVPVMIMNASGNALALESSGGGVPGLPFTLSALPGILGSIAGAKKALGAAVGGGSEIGYKITYPDGSSENLGGTSGLDLGPVFGRLPGAPAYGGRGDTVGYDALDQPSGGGGFFGKIRGFLGGLGGFFGKTPGTESVVTDPFGNSLPGAPAFGGLGALQGSQAATVGAAIGTGLALDGIRRGGFGGTLEAAGGGALVGFKYGGPVGAAIGAAVGGGIALIRSLFGDDRSHTKDLVKQVYGIKINDSTADAIIQIAKQKYGGAISIAVRSQEVRDLLKLYAETIGDKRGKDQFVNDTIHKASLVESGGLLQQSAIYDNGEAYSYASPLSVAGGLSTSLLPTGARDSGSPIIHNLQLSLNGQAAADVLGGQVGRIATPGFIQAGSLSASNASNGRSRQAALTLAPSAITR